MTRILVLVKWFWRAWPILVPVALLIAHYITINFCKLDIIQFNKIASLSLQILGGIIVLYSIDSNIGIINNESLFIIIKKWVTSMPIFIKPVTLQVDSTRHTMTAHPAKLRVGNSTDTIEGKIKYIQQQIEWLKEDLNDEVKHLKDSIQNTDKRISKDVSDIRARVNLITNKVEKVSIGGFKVQFFGVMLMIYGSVVSYYA